MTRVLVDLLFMDGRKGGMELYAHNVYSQLNGDAAAEFEFVALASTELIERGAPWFPGELIDSGISGENRREWAQGELLAVDSRARRVGAELIHCPANFGPWWGTVPTVLTVHDLLPFRLPELTGRSSTVIRALMRGAARHAGRIITDSEQSRGDIEKLLRTRAGVDVIPLAGASPTAAQNGERGITREPALLLALGNRLPHKNFDALLRALALIPEATRPQLVITGGGPDDPLRPLVAQRSLEPWVELAGWLTADEIETLYARATAVVVPTLFEGFGLPVLEAMSHGCPVLCSELPVLREVGGDAAAYFDPRDDHSVAATIMATLGDEARLADLARRGRDRSTLFSWTKTARRTMDSFRQALDAS